MSDSEDSTVTYTEVSSPFEDLSDIGSSGVDGLPMMLEDPYVEAALQAPPSPDYVPKDDMLPTEEQPLPIAVSPTANSPSYIIEPDPKEDPKEDDEDLKEDPTDYPDDKDDDDKESSRDDADDKEEDEDEDEEEEEHPALADSVPRPVHRVTARMLRDESPSTSHPLPLSTPPSGTPPLLPIPLPTSSPPLLLPSTVCRAGRESSSASTARPTRSFIADYGFVGTLDDEIRRDPEREVGYRITDTWDKMVEDMQGTPTAIDVAGLSQRMTDFVTIIRQDTNEIYERLDDAQDDRLLMSGQLNMLRGDRYAHAHTTRLMETEAKLSREAWVQSMDASDTARFKILIDQGVVDALAARDADRIRNGEDSHDSGTGVRRQAPPAREYTYPDFMKCKPLYFKGTEGVFELTQWFERMETVFRISNCSLENQIKFSTCTLLGSALTWWNSHVKTVGHDVAYAMTWKNLKKEDDRQVQPKGRESDKIEKYVGGLPDMIYGNVMASKPKTMQDAIKFATELMDKKIRNFAK
ncbi:hypothetical protein Tco_0961137 [Tanacetum coccineum]